MRSYMYVSHPVSCTSIVLNILFCFINSFYVPITFLVLAIFQRNFCINDHFIILAHISVCGFWSIFENCENNGKIIVEIVQ